MSQEFFYDHSTVDKSCILLLGMQVFQFTFKLLASLQVSCIETFI